MLPFPAIFSITSIIHEATPETRSNTKNMRIFLFKHLKLRELQAITAVDGRTTSSPRAAPDGTGLAAMASERPAARGEVHPMLGSAPGQGRAFSDCRTRCRHVSGYSAIRRGATLNWTSWGAAREAQHHFPPEASAGSRRSATRTRPRQAGTGHRRPEADRQTLQSLI